MEFTNRSSRPRMRMLGLAVAALLATAGCSVIETPSYNRGHKVDTDLLKELVPGTSTRADVQALLGSPTKRATFDDSTWIYISSVTRRQIARRPGLDSQDVTVLTFSPQGTLQNIERLNMDDSLPVQVVDRETPSPGNERSFLQQLFGNLARLNPGIPASGGTGGRAAGGSGAQ